jgi:hypothetical protein
MKNFMILVLIFVSVVFSREHLLENVKVVSLNQFENLVSIDMDFRYIPKGEDMAGTWLDINYGSERVIISLDGPSVDTLMKYLDKYEKWRKIAIENNETITKIMAIFSIPIVFSVPNGTGLGNAEFTLKFGDVNRVYYLVLTIDEVSSFTDTYTYIKPDGIFLDNTSVKKIKEIIKNINWYINKANEQELLEDKYK